MCICMWTVCTCLHMYMEACVYGGMCVYVYEHMCTCLHVYAEACVYVYVCGQCEHICMCIWRHVYTCICTQLHVYMEAGQSQVSSSGMLSSSFVTVLITH